MPPSINLYKSELCMHIIMFIVLHVVDGRQFMAPTLAPNKTQHLSRSPPTAYKLIHIESMKNKNCSLRPAGDHTSSSMHRAVNILYLFS